MPRLLAESARSTKRDIYIYSTDLVANNCFQVIARWWLLVGWWRLWFAFGTPFIDVLSFRNYALFSMSVCINHRHGTVVIKYSFLSLSNILFSFYVKILRTCLNYVRIDPHRMNNLVIWTDIREMERNCYSFSKEM